MLVWGQSCVEVQGVFGGGLKVETTETAFEQHVFTWLRQQVARMPCDRKY